MIAQGVEPRDFNSYGARRGNDRVMTRGTFANIRIRNQLAPGTEGGVTRHLPDGAVMPIYDAAMRYQDEGVPLVVLAGKEYGTGSSRDWAAKGTQLLGVRAVLAASYERIHRSNLVGMGVLPLEFHEGQTWQSLGLTGEETIDIAGLDQRLAPRSEVTRQGHAARRQIDRVPSQSPHRHAGRARILPPRRHSPDGRAKVPRGRLVGDRGGGFLYNGAGAIWSRTMIKTTGTTLHCIIVVLLAAPSVARAETFVSDFPTSFDGWQQQWHKESSTGTDGVVTHSTERGFNDGASLKFDMGDGFGDDGTLWIEKSFAVPAGVPTPVSLSFQLFNLDQSDFNQFQVKSAISGVNPERQEDFATIGITDTAAGWVPFEYDQTVTSPTGQVWVALGVRVAWETHRDYWIDHVAVTVIPEPSTIGLLAIGLAGAYAAQWKGGRLSQRRSAKPPA